MGDLEEKYGSSLDFTIIEGERRAEALWKGG
jgi:hypothetical protein